MRSAARAIFGLLLGWAARVLGLSTAGSWVVARVGGLLLAASDFTFKVDVVVLAFTLVLAALVDMVIDFVAHAGSSSTSRRTPTARWSSRTIATS